MSGTIIMLSDRTVLTQLQMWQMGYPKQYFCNKVWMTGWLRRKRHECHLMPDHWGQCFCSCGGFKWLGGKV